MHSSRPRGINWLSCVFTVLFWATRSEPADILIIVVWCIESFRLSGVQKQICSSPLLPCCALRLHDRCHWCRAENFILVESSDKESPEFSFLGPLGFSFPSYSLHMHTIDGMNFNSARTKWQLLLTYSNIENEIWMDCGGVMICKWKDEFCIASFIGRLPC